MARTRTLLQLLGVLFCPLSLTIIISEPAKNTFSASFLVVHVKLILNILLCTEDTSRSDTVLRLGLSRSAHDCATALSVH